MRYTKRKWKKQFKEGMTNMDFESWQLLHKILDKCSKNQTYDNTWWVGSRQKTGMTHGVYWVESEGSKENWIEEDENDNKE